MQLFMNLVGHRLIASGFPSLNVLIGKLFK